jgi:ribosomal protein L7/L12
MTRLFISYRRADSAYVTDSIYDYMVRHFGKEKVFLDVGSIPFGVDFRAYLRDQIAAHDAVLVIIGPDWAQQMQERGAQANDFVRIEIENALTQNKLVIPVLVMNASMPDFSTLPASIQELQWRNSAVVRRQPDLESDCDRLAQGINAYFAAAEQVQPGSVDAAETTAPVHSVVVENAPSVTYDVILTTMGPNKINLIKAVRRVTGLGLAEAKTLVESAPVLLLRDVSRETALDAKAQVELEAATAQISPQP